MWCDVMFPSPRSHFDALSCLNHKYSMVRHRWCCAGVGTSREKTMVKCWTFSFLFNADIFSIHWALNNAFGIKSKCAIIVIDCSSLLLTSIISEAIWARLNKSIGKCQKKNHYFFSFPKFQKCNSQIWANVKKESSILFSFPKLQFPNLSLAFIDVPLVADKQYCTKSFNFCLFQTVWTWSGCATIGLKYERTLRKSGWS